MKKIILFFSLPYFLLACSSSPPVKSQAYAKLSNSRFYEYEYSVVWKGVESALNEYKMLEKDADEGKLETDWILGQSRNKYQEYKVNGSPRKKYLQTRFKYFLNTNKKMGGVEVVVKTEEEIEKLNTDGSPAGYTSQGEPDSSRANEILSKIENAILSALPENR